MHRRVRPVEDELAQLGHLLRRQTGRTARGHAGDQSVDAPLVVAMHPVAQRLPIHPSQARRLGPGASLQDRSERQQPSGLWRVTALPCNSTQLTRRMVRSGYSHRSAQSSLLFRRIAVDRIESYFVLFENRGVSRGQRGLV